MTTAIEARRANERARYAKNPQPFRDTNRKSKRRQRQAERQCELQSRKLVVRGNRATKAKARAKKAGRAFNIGGMELPIPTYCPLAGIPLDFSDLNRTPTIDRIDNSRGYEPDNVWVVSLLGNAVKREADIETAKRRLARRLARRTLH